MDMIDEALVEKAKGELERAILMKEVPMAQCNECAIGCGVNFNELQVWVRNENIGCCPFGAYLLGSSHTIPIEWASPLPPFPQDAIQVSLELPESWLDGVADGWDSYENSANYRKSDYLLEYRDGYTFGEYLREKYLPNPEPSWDEELDGLAV